MKTKQLKALAKVAKSKTLPIIDGNALIKDGRMLATDLETAISYPCDIKGTAVISVKQLSKMKFDSLSLNENALHVKKGNGVFTLPYEHAPEEFPMPAEDKKPKRMGKISGSTIDAIKSAFHFAANDNLRPAMNAVYLDEENVVATDAHKLAFLKKDKRHVSGLLIPRWVVPYMTEDSYSVHEIGGRILLKGDEEHIYFKQVDSKFPNYRAIISGQSRAVAHVDTGDLKQAAKDGLAVANTTTHSAAFSFEAGKLEVLIPNQESNDIIFSQKILMGWVVAPETRFVIGLNLKYLLTILDQIKENTVEIRVDQGNRAIYFNDQFLLMPVMLPAAGETSFLKYPTGWSSPYAPKDGFTPGDQVFADLDNSRKTHCTFFGYTGEGVSLIGFGENIDGSPAPMTFIEVDNSRISYSLEQTEESEKEEKVRFNPHDILILTTRQDKEIVVNFRGYTNEEETRAMVAAPELGGQMEVDVSQLRTMKDQPEPEQQPTDEQEDQPDAEQPISDNEKSEDFSGEEHHEPTAESNPEKEDETEPPYIREYSERAIVVLGDTKPLRSKLKANKGKWIPKGLMIDGEPVAGWIFSKKRLPEVEKIIMG